MLCKTRTAQTQPAAPLASCNPDHRTLRLPSFTAMGKRGIGSAASRAGGRPKRSRRDTAALASACPTAALEPAEVISATAVVRSEPGTAAAQAKLEADVPAASKQARRKARAAAAALQAAAKLPQAAQQAFMAEPSLSVANVTCTPAGKPSMPAGRRRKPVAVQQTAVVVAAGAQAAGKTAAAAAAPEEVSSVMQGSLAQAAAKPAGRRHGAKLAAAAAVLEGAEGVAEVAVQAPPRPRRKRAALKAALVEDAELTVTLDDDVKPERAQHAASVEGAAEQPEAGAATAAKLKPRRKKKGDPDDYRAALPLACWLTLWGGWAKLCSACKAELHQTVQATTKFSCPGA